MKHVILLVITTFTLTANAQTKHFKSRDSVTQKAGIKNTLVNRKAIGTITVKAEIEIELNKIMDVYKNEPNTTTTWKKIKAEADNILYNYFKNGKLLGNKITEAYFVKIGNETMTATDISNHTIILIAGIAPVKPADFEVIRIEKTRTN